MSHESQRSISSGLFQIYAFVLNQIKDGEHLYCLDHFLSLLYRHVWVGLLTHTKAPHMHTHLTAEADISRTPLKI